MKLMDVFYIWLECFKQNRDDLNAGVNLGGMVYK